jgi:hypothetical protein
VTPDKDFALQLVSVKIIKRAIEGKELACMDGGEGV